MLKKHLLTYCVHIIHVVYIARVELHSGGWFAYTNTHKLNVSLNIEIEKLKLIKLSIKCYTYCCSVASKKDFLYTKFLLSYS